MPPTQLLPAGKLEMQRPIQNTRIWSKVPPVGTAREMLVFKKQRITQAFGLCSQSSGENVTFSRVSAQAATRKSHVSGHVSPRCPVLPHRHLSVWGLHTCASSTCYFIWVTCCLQCVLCFRTTRVSSSGFRGHLECPSEVVLAPSAFCNICHPLSFTAACVNV